MAKELGEKLAQTGSLVTCGGRAGIMEAVCKGGRVKNGFSIGLLPEADLENANEFITIPLTTGIGFARNSIIAASSLCLIAIGGRYRTLSEIAYGSQFGKKAFTLGCNLPVDNTIVCHTIEEILENICKTVFSAEHIK